MMSSGETVFGVKSTGRDAASWCSAHSGIFFFFPAVSSTEMQVFFTAWPVFVFRTCEQKTFSRRVGQMETIDGLEWRRRSMQAGRHSDRATESY